MAKARTPLKKSKPTKPLPFPTAQELSELGASADGWSLDDFWQKSAAICVAVASLSGPPQRLAAELDQDVKTAKSLHEKFVSEWCQMRSDIAELATESVVSWGNLEKERSLRQRIFDLKESADQCNIHVIGTCLAQAQQMAALRYMALKTKTEFPGRQGRPLARTSTGKLLHQFLIDAANKHPGKSKEYIYEAAKAEAQKAGVNCFLSWHHVLKIFKQIAPNWKYVRPSSPKRP